MAWQGGFGWESQEEVVKMSTRAAVPEVLTGAGGCTAKGARLASW